MQQERNNNTKLTQGDAVGLIYLIAKTHATGITPIIRSRHGCEAFNPYAFFALIAMALLSANRWGSAMGVYLIVWFFAVVYRRIETLRLRMKGIVLHSRQVGYPWLAMKFWFVKNVDQAQGFEPLMCLVIGGLLCIVSDVLGGFIMTGCASLLVCLCIEKYMTFKQVQQMQDAQIEGEFYAGEFKRG